MKRWVARLRIQLQRLRDHPRWSASLLLALLVVSFFVSVGSGAVEVGPLDIPRALLQEEHPDHTVVADVRMPRVAAGAAVGAALAVAGVLLQTVVRNPLADPGILGVSAGAGLAAVATLIFAPDRAAWVPFFAFLGALTTVGLLLALSWSRGATLSALRLVLSGVAVQAIFIAAMALLTFAFAERAPAFAAFLVGSLNGLGWQDFALLAPPTLIGLAAAQAAARPLDVMLLDDATAGGLGMSVKPARLAASSLSALLAAAAVSVAGLVGFVGLVVPNAVRVISGPEHSRLLVRAALGGASLVLLADTVARTLIAPLELPVGAILALIGGPTFLGILWKKLP